MTSTHRLFLDHLDTAIGRLAIVADAAGRLHAVGFTDGDGRMDRQLRSYEDALTRTSNAGGLTAKIAAYFAGDLASIEDLPAVAEGTEFQRAVWNALREIPTGETRSYGDIARRIGRPSAVRAVGLANGANPIGVVVPCHRVIGADGSLTGYGGGVDRKRWLLAHERAPSTVGLCPTREGLAL